MAGAGPAGILQGQPGEARGGNTRAGDGAPVARDPPQAGGPPPPRAEEG